MNNHQIERSEGEIFLEEFLNSEGIDYQVEVKLINLKEDTKAYRVADFYLPKYKVYIEFLGRWNASEEAKKLYKEKMKVYSRNLIPCIYIYPENLGIIHYSFNYRIRKVLREFNLNRELKKYNIKLLIDDKGDAMLGLLFAIILLIAFQFDRDAGLYWQSCAVVATYAIFKIYKIISSYILYFKNDYSYVNFEIER